MERKGFNSEQKSQSGYSLVELMIGIFLIGGAALMVSQFSTQFDSKPTAFRRACESHTSSVISVVSEETPYREILSFIPTGNAPNRRAGVFASGTRAVPNRNDYLALSLAIADMEPFQIAKPEAQMPNGLNPPPQAGPRLQSFQLIQGSIRSLATIYNRNASIRCQYGIYAPVTNGVPIPTASFTGATGINVRMKIEPYNIVTGQSLCPNGLTRVFPGPPGLSTRATNAFITGSGNPSTAGYAGAVQTQEQGAGTPGNDAGYTLNTVAVNANDTVAHRNTAGPIDVGDPNLGLRLFVDMRYQLEGTNYNCASSQNFEYPADRSPPDVPDRAEVVIASTNNSLSATTGMWDHCGPPIGQGTISFEVGYAAVANPEPGVQFLCKDLSWVREIPPGTELPCYTRSGNAAGPGTFQVTQPRPATPTTGHINTTNNLQFSPYDVEKDHRTRAWVPCDHLPICDQPPSSATAVGSNRYQMSYANLPFGCHVNLEVVAVDTAGNRSPITAPRFFDRRVFATVTIDAQQFSTRVNEIYHPTCGNSGPDYVAGLGVFCAPDTNPASPTYWGSTLTLPGISNGYYTCRDNAGFFGAKAGDAGAGCCRNGGPGNECRPWN